MAHHVALQYSALSDKGMVRARNEDAVASLPDPGVAVLADGMGGYRAGEVASRIAIDVCTDSLQSALDGFDWSAATDRTERLAQLLTDAVIRANNAIFDASRQDAAFAGMGTTLVLTLLHHDKVIIAHVGDSRVYRLRDAHLEQITRDHSQIQEQIDAGLICRQQARFAANRNLVTRAVGIDRRVEVEIGVYTSRVGDVYLLCSDGLSDMVDDPEIEKLLCANDVSLDVAAASLVERANALGGLDNVSVVLIRVEGVTEESPGLLGRMLDWVR